jgi:hypothetical protein
LLQSDDARLLNAFVGRAQEFREAAGRLARRSEQPSAASELRAITDRLGLLADEAIDVHIRAEALRVELGVISRAE